MSVGPGDRVKHSVARNPGSISAAWSRWTMDMAPKMSPVLVFCFVPFKNFCENLCFVIAYSVVKLYIDLCSVLEFC